MTDDLHTLIDALRVSTTELPEGFASAPILDSWAVKRAFGCGPLIITGCVSGDPRWRDGTVIYTSEVQRIDARSSVRWARTCNTLYRLGAPNTGVSLVAAVALTDDWMDALTLTALLTGEHTLSGAALNIYTELLEVAASSDWTIKRTYAARLAAAMELSGRFDLQTAWMLIAGDPRNPVDASLVHDFLKVPLNEVGSDKANAVLAAWDALATGSFSLTGNEQDHIAMAHRVGALLALARKRPFRPLLLRMALCRTWVEAIELLLTELPPRHRLAAEAFAPLPERWRFRLWSARFMAECLRGNGDEKCARCFDLLAVDPQNRYAAAAVVSHLNELIAAGRSNEEDALMAGWRLLANGEYPKDCEDPIAAAWYASAGRGSAGVEKNEPRSEAAASVGDENEPDTASATEPPGIVVLPRLGGTSHTNSGKEVEKEFKEMVGERMPLLLAPKLSPVRAKLVDEFPHLVAQIDLLLTGMMEGEPIRLRRPVLLVGPPGGGKTALGRKFAQALGVPLHRFDGSGSADNAFGGTPRRWSSGEHCVPLEAVRRACAANTFLLVDEVDKGGSGHNGSLDRALLPFLESENSCAYPDPFTQSECNLAFVNFILTANDLTVLPQPLRDRLCIIELPQPSIEHLPQLARSIVADIAKHRGGDPRWFPMLEDHELAIAETLWPGGSLRRLRAIIERIMACREQSPWN